MVVTTGELSNVDKVSMNNCDKRKNVISTIRPIQKGEGKQSHLVEIFRKVFII